MIEGTGITHFTVLVMLDKAWLMSAAQHVEATGQPLAVGVVVEATHARYKVVSEMPGVEMFCGCGDLSDTIGQSFCGNGLKI